MPYSERHRFAFVHIPKTAGTSVISVLRAFDPDIACMEYGLLDLISGRSDGAHILSAVRKIYRANTSINFPRQHLPAKALRAILGGMVWNEFFTFSFVRNPWDLVVSTYHFLQHTYAAADNHAALNPDQVDIIRRSKTFDDYARLNPLVRGDMCSILEGDDGQLIVDFIGGFEDLDRDFRIVAQRIGLDAPLPQLNVTTHFHYRNYYTNTTRDIVGRHFARDIDRFHYDF